jgi:hypothetical protein
VSNENPSWGQQSQPASPEGEAAISTVRYQTGPTGERTKMPSALAHSLVGASGHLAVLGTSAEFRDDTEILSID